MSSIKLDTIIDEFPDEREAVERLVSFINDNARFGSGARVFSMNRLYDVIHPSSQRVLIKMLMRAIEFGYVEKILRVQSPARGGIGDFKSLQDIPSVIYDTRMGREVEVSLDQVQLMYKIHSTAISR